MAEVTYLVALPFVAADDGVAAGEPTECFNPVAVVSRRALSLVFPDYGYMPGMWRFPSWLCRIWPAGLPDEIGIHAFIDGKWRRLNRPAACAVLNVANGPRPQLIDLRS